MPIMAWEVPSERDRYTPEGRADPRAHLAGEVLDGDVRLQFVVGVCSFLLVVEGFSINCWGIS